MQPRGPSYVWAGWQEAVARLGLDAFTEPLRGLFDRGWIDPTWQSFADFQEPRQKNLWATSGSGSLPSA